MKVIQRIYRLLLNLRQRTNRLLSVITVCVVAAIGMNSSVLAQPDIWYVDGTVTECDEDGTTWAKAFKYLQDALAEADGLTNDQIWVRAGEYFVDQDCANPDGTGLRTATFELVEGVKLYGGFDGTETLLIQRDPVLNITILNGTLVASDPPDPPDACTIPNPGWGNCFIVTPGIKGC